MKFSISQEALKTFSALAVAVGMCLSAIWYFASAEDLRLVEMRLEQKVVSDQVMQLQQRIWSLEDRYKGSDCVNWSDQKDRDEYRKLKEDLELLKKRQERLLR